jgi:hypothetical protein
MRIILALLLLQACGGDEMGDVTGDYTLALTNGANECGFANWTVGATSTGVAVKFIQTDGGKFTAELTDPLVRLYVDLIVGSHIFAGEVTGASFQGTLAGTRELMEEGKTCKYRVNADIDGSLVRDNIGGMISYRVVIIVPAADCPASSCTTVASFNGSRPAPI